MQFNQPDTLVPDTYNTLDWNRYSYARYNPLRYTDPTGHCPEEDAACRKNLAILLPKPKFHSFDGGWNDPRFSTWNLLRQGSACTACHVTHDQPGDWGIPTNDELSLTQVQGWRSLDKYAIPVHLGGVGITTFYASEAIAAADPLTYIPNEHQETVSNAFTDWQVNRTSESMSVYRYTGPGEENPGRWLTQDPTLVSAEARSVLALPNSNAATSVTQYVIPAETTYISGGVASQTSASGFGSYATGGGYQIYLSDPSVLLPVPLLPMP